MERGGGSKVQYVGANGIAVPIPQGWKYKGAAANNRGGVWQQPGAIGNADSIRIMEPGADPRYPNGYMRYYNGYGQPLDVNGNPGNPASTHIPLDYQGSIPGLPR